MHSEHLVQGWHEVNVTHHGGRSRASLALISWALSHRLFYLIYLLVLYGSQRARPAPEDGPNPPCSLKLLDLSLILVLSSLTP